MILIIVGFSFLTHSLQEIWIGFAPFSLWGLLVDVIWLVQCGILNFGEILRIEIFQNWAESFLHSCSFKPNLVSKGRIPVFLAFMTFVSWSRSLRRPWAAGVVIAIALPFQRMDWCSVEERRICLSTLILRNARCSFWIFSFGFVRLRLWYFLRRLSSLWRRPVFGQWPSLLGSALCGLRATNPILLRVWDPVFLFRSDLSFLKRVVSFCFSNFGVLWISGVDLRRMKIVLIGEWIHSGRTFFLLFWSLGFGVWITGGRDYGIGVGLLLVDLLLALMRLLLPSILRMRPLLSFWNFLNFGPSFSHFHRLTLRSLILYPSNISTPKRHISHCFDSSHIINPIIDNHSRNILPHIFHERQPFQQRNIMYQLLICFIIIPILDRHPILRLEQIRNRWIVQDNHIFQISSQPTHVLYKDIVVKCTMFPVELRSAIVVRV